MIRNLESFSVQIKRSRKVCFDGWFVFSTHLVETFFPYLNLVFNLLSSSNYLKYCSLDIIFPVLPNAPNHPMFHSQTSNDAFIHFQFGPQTWGSATSPPRSWQDKTGILEAIGKTIAEFGLGFCLPSILSSTPSLLMWFFLLFNIVSPLLHPTWCHIECIVMTEGTILSKQSFWMV